MQRSVGTRLQYGVLGGYDTQVTGTRPVDVHREVPVSLCLPPSREPLDGCVFGRWRMLRADVSMVAAGCSSVDMESIPRLDAADWRADD